MIGVQVQTPLGSWRSTLLSSFISAIAVCCGVLSIGQSSPDVPSNDAVSLRWIAADAAVPAVSLDHLPEWARITPNTPRLTAARPDGSAGDSDDDDDGDNDDAPGAALAPAPTTLTADSGRTQHAPPHEIGRHISPTSDGHSLRAPPQ